MKRIVVKVGSSTLSRDFNLNVERLDAVVQDLAQVRQHGREVILVSSGAIAAGVGKLCLLQRPRTLPGLQAAAAVGQIRLMHAYESRFQQHNLVAAMMLLTRDDFNSRKRYTHMSDTLHELLRRKVVPIINENDTVAVDEIKVGDNDTLAAYVTNLAEADALIILSDQPGFFTGDPRKVMGAQLINIVPEITDALREAAGSTGSLVGTGGMSSKLRAAEIVTGSGEMMVLASGSEPFAVSRILAGEELGTLFLSGNRLSGKKRWIAYSRQPKGRLFVDNGARDAVLHRNTSLLPSGVRRIEGDFGFRDTVSCHDENAKEFAKGLVNYSADELRRILGRKSSDIKAILGYHYYDEVIHRDHLVVMRNAKA